MQLTPQPRSKDEVARVDRRWILTAAVIFAGTLGGLFGAVALYRATGPHPEVTLFVRKVKLYANGLLRHRLRRQ